MASIYKVLLKLQCPFDTFGVMPPQDTEICYLWEPGQKPVFGPPNVCDECNGTNLSQCKLCVKALYLMFERGLIPLEPSVSRPLQVLSQPIRPSLALLSERS